MREFSKYSYDNINFIYNAIFEAADFIAAII